MIVRRTSLLAVFVLVVAVATADFASARRPATPAEHAAIVRGLPASYRASIAKAAPGCVALIARVSTSGRFATVTPRFSPRAACLRFASDGFFVLRRTANRWKTIYNGSDEPPCSLGVPRDLIVCR